MWNRLVLAPLLAMLTALAQAEVVKFEVLHTVPDDAGQPGANSERQVSHARGSSLARCHPISPLSGYDVIRTKPAAWKRASLDRLAASSRAASSVGARAIASALAAKALNASSDPAHDAAHAPRSRGH